MAVPFCGAAAQPVVARVVIELGGGKDHTCRPLPRHLLQIGPAGEPTTAVAPRALGGIAPAAVRQTATVNLCPIMHSCLGA